MADGRWSRFGGQREPPATMRMRFASNNHFYVQMLWRDNRVGIATHWDEIWWSKGWIESQWIREED